MGNVLWALHPSSGRVMTTAKHPTHAQWFHDEELPYSGSGFDRIVRGYAHVDHKAKTASLTSYHSEFAPNSVARHFKTLGYQPTDTMQEPDKYMSYVRQNYPFTESLKPGSVVLFAEHPRHGVHSIRVADFDDADDAVHASWFHKMGWYDVPFDKIQRGSATAMHSGGMFLNMSSDHPFASQSVVNHLASKYGIDKKSFMDSRHIGEASYPVLLVANGGNPFDALAEADSKDLVPTDHLGKALSTTTGRRGFIQRSAGAIAANPVARALAVQAGTQAVVHGVQAATQAITKPVAPPRPSHIEHPQAGVEGSVIPTHELIAHGTNLFAKEHGIDYHVEPHEAPSVYRAHGVVTTPKKFDWEKYGDHSESLYRARRESRIDEPLKLLGWQSSGKIPYEHHVAMSSTDDILKSNRFQKDESGGRFGGEHRHDEPGWSVYHDPRASHSRMEVHKDGTWVHRWETHGDSDNWHEEHGQDKLSMARHLNSSADSIVIGCQKNKNIMSVEHYTHPDHPNQRYTKYNLDVAPHPEMGRGPDTAFWDKHKKSDMPGKEHEWETQRLPSYEGSPFHHELQSRTVTAYENAKKSTEYKNHQEDHSRILTFTGKDKGGVEGVVTNPVHPDYDHDAFMKAHQKSTNGVYVVENPYHWDNLKPHEFSPHDKRGFDAMHIANDGKVTRFHVPSDMSDTRNSHVMDNETGLSHSQMELVKKKTMERHQAIQGTPYKHYKAAVKSAMPNAEWSGDHEYQKAVANNWRDTDNGALELERPVTLTHSTSHEEHYETPSGDYRRRTVYTPHSSGLKITFHPGGKWQVHQNDTLRGEGESPADLRKVLRKHSSVSESTLRVANGSDPILEIQHLMCMRPNGGVIIPYRVPVKLP